MSDSIRAGKYRTIEISDDKSVIVVLDDFPCTKLCKSIEVSAVGDNRHNIENCAVMLAMCLNSGFDTVALHEALSKHMESVMQIHDAAMPRWNDPPSREILREEV